MGQRPSFILNTWSATGIPYIGHACDLVRIESSAIQGGSGSMGLVGLARMPQSSTIPICVCSCLLSGSVDLSAASESSCLVVGAEPKG
jgi:hypothetical protein